MFKSFLATALVAVAMISGVAAQDVANTEETVTLDKAEYAQLQAAVTAANSGSGEQMIRLAQTLHRISLTGNSGDSRTATGGSTIYEADGVEFIAPYARGAGALALVGVPADVAERMLNKTMDTMVEMGVSEVWKGYTAEELTQMMEHVSKLYQSSLERFSQDNKTTAFEAVILTYYATLIDNLAKPTAAVAVNHQTREPLTVEDASPPVTAPVVHNDPVTVPDIDLDPVPANDGGILDSNIMFWVLSAAGVLVLVYVGRIAFDRARKAYAAYRAKSAAAPEVA